MVWTRAGVSPRPMLGRSTKSWSLGSHRCWLSGARHRARHHPRRRIRLHQLRLHRRPHLRLSHLRLHPHRPRLAFSTAGGVRRFRSRSAERDGGSLVSNFELLDRLELRSFWAGRGACANGLADLASVGLWTKRRYKQAELQSLSGWAVNTWSRFARQRGSEAFPPNCCPPRTPTPTPAPAPAPDRTKVSPAAMCRLQWLLVAKPLLAALLGNLPSSRDWQDVVAAADSALHNNNSALPTKLHELSSWDFLPPSTP